MKTNKKIFLIGLAFSALMGINTAFAAEEIVYYDDRNLDDIFENYEAYDNNKKPQEEITNQNQTENPPADENQGQKEDVYHYKEDGTLAKGLTDLGNVRRYFDRETGQLIKNKTFTSENIHVDENGEAHFIGWDYYNGKLGYYNPKTGYTKGLMKIDGDLYGFDENGNMLRSRNRSFDGVNYYFNKFGRGKKAGANYQTGWVGDRYYFSDGSAATGLVKIGGVNYIFNDRDKRLLRNARATHNHKLYKTNAYGVATFIKNVNYPKLSKGTKGKFKPGFSQNLGRKTPYYNQNDKRWAKVAYANANMSDLGCGPTAMAMVLSRKFNDDEIYPTNMLDVANYYSSTGGTYWQYFTQGPEAYGLKTYDVPIKKEAFIQALKENPIVVRVGPGHFIFCGHYLVIDSYKDGYFLINDPNYSKRNTLDKHPWSRLEKEVTIAWQIK